jgi:hypothetical protein
MNKFIEQIPKEVNICGIMYRVIEVEGMIVFSELYGMCFCGQRVAFIHPKYGLWQVEIKPSFGTTISMSHLEEMFKLVQEWRGDDFGRPINDNK